MFPKKTNLSVLLLLLAIVAIIVGSSLYAKIRVAPSTYLIMSRTLRQRDTNGHGVERCWVAAYRWRLGSQEEPKFISSVASIDDCYSGFEVRDNQLYQREYKDNTSKETVLGLNGRIKKTASHKETPSSASSNAGSGITIEALPQGYADVTIRVSDKEGHLLRERTFNGLAIAHVSPNRTTIYLETSEVPDGYNGPWYLLAYDWKNDHLEPITEAEGSRNYEERAFEPGGNRLLYVKNKSVRDPEGHGWKAATPSYAHLLDLDSGVDVTLRSVTQGEPFSNPRFSPDGKRYAVRTPGAETIYDLVPNGPAVDSIVPKITDWFDDTVVINEFELIVRNLNTKENLMPSKDFASFEYVGKIIVP